MADSRAALRFSKMHGAGNDFVMLDLRDGALAPDAVLAAHLCNRRRGVGCDQIIGIGPARSAGAAASYRIWNADGSSSQQCGNGARCVAAWLVRDGLQAPRFQLDSPQATHEVEVLGHGHYSIAMGVPQFDPRRIPMAGFDAVQERYDLDPRGGLPQVGAVSMGNPHAVIEVADVAAAAVSVLGPQVQRCSAFPESVNVGFAQVVAPDHVRLRVYERGVGETLACGSGACAAAVVLMRRGQLERQARVSLPGGELLVRWPDDAGEVIMSGPTAFVFEGEWLQ